MKLSIYKGSQKQLFWDKWVEVTNKAEAKALIYNLKDLD